MLSRNKPVTHRRRGWKIPVTPPFCFGVLSLISCSCTVFYHLVLHSEDSLRTVDRIPFLSLGANRGQNAPPLSWIEARKVTKHCYSLSLLLGTWCVCFLRRHVVPSQVGHVKTDVPMPDSRPSSF